MLTVDRVPEGGEQRVASILVEAATWLIDMGRSQWSLDGLESKVAAARAAAGTGVAKAARLHLPPVTWQDVATKQDLGALGAELRAAIAGLRADPTNEIAGQRTEMASLRGDMAALRGESATSAAMLQSRIDRAITQQTWKLATFVGA